MLISSPESVKPLVKAFKFSYTNLIGKVANLKAFVNILNISVKKPVLLAHSEKPLIPSAILSIKLVKAPPSEASPIVKNNSSKALPNLFCARLSYQSLL